MKKTENNILIQRSFQTLLENSTDMIFVKDTNLIYAAASLPFAQMIGAQDIGQLCGRTDYDIFPSALAHKYTEDDRQVLLTGQEVIDLIEPLPDYKGHKRYSSTSKFIVRGDDGSALGVLGIARDITDKMELEAERERNMLSSQMFDSVLEADLSENRVLRLEGAGWMSQLNILPVSSYSEMLEAMAHQFVHPKHIAEFIACFRPEKLINEFAGKGKKDFGHITCLQSDNGCYRWVECTARIYHSRVSETIRMTAFLKDVDDEIRSTQRLQQKATTDALTGLCNREAVLQRIEEALKGAGNEGMHALLFIDLDCFKQVNDNWGHRFGDMVLKKTAESLQSVLDEEEIFGRIGGDEFLAFMPHVSSRQAVEEKAGRLLERLPFYYEQDGRQIKVTSSVGISLCRGDGMTVEKLYEQADKAMYRAKEHGRNQMYFFDDMGM